MDEDKRRRFPEVVGTPEGMEVLPGPADGYRGIPRDTVPAPAAPPATAAARRTIVPIADKSPSCFAWTPRQMLQAFIDAIDRGEEAPVGMVIVYTEVDAQKMTSVHSWRAQLGWTDEYTYLEVAQQQCLDLKKV